MILENAANIRSLDWSYLFSFDGFKRLLTEMNVTDYNLMIDREGDESNTLTAAKYEGLHNVLEVDSKYFFGIRMADLLAGVISKLMQSLNVALLNNYKNGEIKKTLLDTGWFSLSEKQLNLYKKLYRVICENNNYWYKSFAGIYSDDLVSFVSLLQFINHFEVAEEIYDNKLGMQPEYYNSFVMERLRERYRIMHL